MTCRYHVTIAAAIHWNAPSCWGTKKTVQSTPSPSLKPWQNTSFPGNRHLNYYHFAQFFFFLLLPLAWTLRSSCRTHKVKCPSTGTKETHPWLWSWFLKNPNLKSFWLKSSTVPKLMHLLESNPFQWEACKTPSGFDWVSLGMHVIDIPAVFSYSPTTSMSPLAWGDEQVIYNWNWELKFCSSFLAWGDEQVI